MNRETALQALAQHKAHLVESFGVSGLALFGSTARDSASQNSDLDVLVSFTGPATSDRFFGVQFYLEDALGCPVDLVTEKALRPELKPYVLRDLVHV
jgi:predicted nucleotidyltransferase